MEELQLVRRMKAGDRWDGGGDHCRNRQISRKLIIVEMCFQRCKRTDPDCSFAPLFSLLSPGHDIMWMRKNVGVKALFNDKS